MDFIGNFHLCAPFEKAHAQNVLFSAGQLPHGFFECDLLQPVFIGIFGVADLIHDVDRITAVFKYRLI